MARRPNLDTDSSYFLLALVRLRGRAGDQIVEFVLIVNMEIKGGDLILYSS